VTVVTFAVEHNVEDGFTNSEAFWMTICSTVVSTITSFTLIWDFVVTPNFAKAGKSIPALLHQGRVLSPHPGSGITHRQRSLIIVTMIFLTYVALGALISSLMMNLTFVNGLFFTIVTTLTIGFGDIVPKTAAQRFAVCLYAIFGIVILSAGIRLTSEAVLEGLQIGYRRRLREYKKHRKARKREREQARRWRAAVEERLVGRGHPVWTSDNPVSHNTRPATLRGGSGLVVQAMYLNTEVLSQDELEAAAKEAGVPLDKFIGRKFGRRARNRVIHHHHRDHDQQQPSSPQQQQQQQHQRPGKEGERPARVPMEFTWTIDEGRTQEEKNGMWGSVWWDRARRALRLANAGHGTSDPNEDSNGGMTYQEMVKTLEGDERRSLYTKVRYPFLEDAPTMANLLLMSAWAFVGHVLHLLDSE
jgi:hypothetical protein